MKQTDAERISHYCKQLNLYRWDAKDIKKYFIQFEKIENGTNTFSDNIEFKKMKSIIFQSELSNICHEFHKYLRFEPVLFGEISISDPFLSKDEVWDRVYSRIDLIIEKEIKIAKQGTQGGCAISVFLFFLIISLSSLVFA